VSPSFAARVRTAGGAFVGGLLLVALAILAAIGMAQPAQWWGPNYAFGSVPGTDVTVQPPFPPLSRMEVFNSDVQSVGTHFYLLGSDAAGRDLLALVAHAAIPSALLVTAVVVARLLIGVLAGFAMANGFTPIRVISRGMGRWISGFPYLMLAIILIEATTPSGRWSAFIIGMALVGWRDIAETVASQIEYVRTQTFALGAKALGTGPLMFFRLHVVPYLRSPLAVEVPFQASAVLVLLAELGYLGVFIGGATVLSENSRGGGVAAGFTIVNQPELGQLLAPARLYVERHQFAPVLVPALAVAAAAFAFELIGAAIRARRDQTAV
jgi:ABC-type dipeptide/oligopeptide/nickel transport system permease subunit